MAKEYIERELALRQLTSSYNRVHDGKTLVHPMAAVAFRVIRNTPAADVVEVVSGYREGDVCIYGFGHENKSRAIVEIVKILNDERGVAEVKFHKVFVDDTGNGYFNYLLKSGNTMNASFQYLKNITPKDFCSCGERRDNNAAD